MKNDQRLSEDIILAKITTFDENDIVIKIQRSCQLLSGKLGIPLLVVQLCKITTIQP